DNVQKGYRYETLFGAHRIARLLRRYIDHGEDAMVEWQSEGFVDDLVVRRDARTSMKAYQLKNAHATTWSEEIEGDFASQYRLSDAEGYTDIRLRLVCSDAQAVAALNPVPAAIAEFSHAFYFPWNPAILAVLIGHPWMAQD